MFRRMRSLRWAAWFGLGSVVLSTAHAEENPRRASVAMAEEPIVRYTLPNGLRVVLQEDHRQPRVAVVMAYGVGSRDDPEGYGQLAHLVEHLTFRGSRHLPGRRGRLLLHRAGATGMNGSTGADHTWYTVEVPAEELPLALWVESERLAFTLESWTPQAFDAERRIVANELREKETPPGSHFGPLLLEALYPDDHPHHRSVRDRVRVGRLRLPHAQWFYQNWYRPSNAVLVLVGSFDPALARGLIERYFAPIQAVPPSRPRAPDHPLVLARELRVVVDAPVTAERLGVIWPVVLRDRQAAPLLQLVRTILERRLQSELVDQLDLASSVRVRLDAHATYSLLWVDAVLARGHELAAAEQRLHAVVQALQFGALTPTELHAARLATIQAELTERERLLDRARELGRSELDQRTLSARERLRILEEVQLSQVIAALGQWLPADRRCVGWLRSRPGAASGQLYGVSR